MKIVIVIDYHCMATASYGTAATTITSTTTTTTTARRVVGQ
jgi:hypothetical protein